MKLARMTGIGVAVALALGFAFLLGLDDPKGGPARQLLEVFNAPFAEREGAWNRAEREAAESRRTIGRLGRPLALTDQHGEPWTNENFRGRPVLLFFGYTRCGAPCEDALRGILGALDELGNEAPAIVPVFVTLDPAYDTPARLARYVATFDPRLVALTGPEDAIRRLASSYRIFYRRSEGANGARLDASAYIFLVDGNGAYRAHFRPDLGKDGLARALGGLF